jgi:hypothetical protein
MTETVDVFVIGAVFSGVESGMLTFGFRFRPCLGTKVLADGPSIRNPGTVLLDRQPTQDGVLQFGGDAVTATTQGVMPATA